MGVAHEQRDISVIVQQIRKFLYAKDFFEKHLYNLSKFPVNGTDVIETSINNVTLRTTTEPDVWIISKEIERFFYLGSLFRNEHIDRLHTSEFTVADMYMRGEDSQTITDLFMELIRHLSEQSVVHDLSTLQSDVIKFKNFTENEVYQKKDAQWLLVTHYPIEESFYDVMLDGDWTHKSELFFLFPGMKPIEVASLGRVGKNKNPLLTIDETDVVRKCIDETLVGIGFGIERLLLVSDLYKNKIK